MTLSVGRPAIAAAIGYGGLWAAAVYYLSTHGTDPGEPLAITLIFGVLLSLVALGLTRGVKAPAVPVARPGTEVGAIVGYLLLYAFIFLGPVMSGLKASIAPGPAQELAVMATKLLVHVGLPLLLLLLLGARLKPLLESRLGGRRFWVVFLVLTAIILGVMTVVSPSLDNIAKTGAGIGTLAWVAPVSFIWVTLEAGLSEEVLFRAILQTRLAAFLKSNAAAIALMAVLFALAHAPGLYLRGDAETFGASKDVWQVIAHTIAVLSPIGITFGILWARTRSLLLVVLLHGMVDFLPNLSDFIETWVM